MVTPLWATRSPSRGDPPDTVTDQFAYKWATDSRATIRPSPLVSTGAAVGARTPDRRRPWRPTGRGRPWGARSARKSRPGSPATTTGRTGAQRYMEDTRLDRSPYPDRHDDPQWWFYAWGAADTSGRPPHRRLVVPLRPLRQKTPPPLGLSRARSRPRPRKTSQAPQEGSRFRRSRTAGRRSVADSPKRDSREITPGRPCRSRPAVRTQGEAPMPRLRSLGCRARAAECGLTGIALSGGSTH